VTVAYATVDELETFLSAANVDALEPDEIPRILERATETVDDHVFGCFEIDSETQLPTDTDVAAALRDAVCAQVEFWLDVGEEHDVEGIRGQTSIGGTTWNLPGTLAPRARRFLSTQQLTHVPGGT